MPKLFIKDYWIWLIETQLEEIREHTDLRKAACEFSDIISISLEAIRDLGFEPEEIMNERLSNIEPRIMEIIKRYDKLWQDHKKYIKIQDKQKDSYS